MTYQLKDYKNYLKKLEMIKEYDWVQKFLELKEKPNFWTIIEYGRVKSSQERSAHETRYSKMIRWLLDPNETHNLGNIFAHKILDLVAGELKHDPDKNKAVNVTNEFMNIDVFYKDFLQNICIAIEVKQFDKERISEEGISQLDNYEESLEEWIKEGNKELRPYYIFLTPLKDVPSNDRWHAVGYVELIQIIDKVYEEYILKSDDRYIEDTKKIMMDFKDDLERTMYLEMKDRGINILSLNEEKLTKDLAREIQSETDSEHLDKLMELAQDEIPVLEQVILMIDEYIARQDRTPNVAVQLLLRKIYNYLSDGMQLNTDEIVEYKNSEETIVPLKKNLIEKYTLELSHIRLTADKGQGLYLTHKEGKYEIYFSGAAGGNFPNDYIHLRPPKGFKRTTARAVKKDQFNVDKNLILENKITDRNGHVIDLEQLMEEYVLKGIKELDDFAIESNYNK
ncbi:PD-(D/E)XK nuclease family protein [Virgibacillus sp. W0430]|uniref:PD-(D/E)XK nuclease family protein n=1 Tax=Virgibacillus sp. W0430 TaxID=3391580 RepID=UPI003F4476F6